MASPPPGVGPYQTSSSVLHTGNNSNILIHGGNFSQHNNNAQIVHNCHDADDGFKHLQAHVATSAFDAEQNADTSKCHPNTRQVVLREIMNWILQTTIRIQFIMWLHGAAGAGKSAIGRSIIELCIAHDVPIASFFFYRTDSTRNNIKPVVATLLHQILHHIPALKSIVIPRIESDSLIFTKSLETQLKYLIFDPLLQLHQESPLKKILVLLLDGIDECDGEKNQTTLIRTIALFLRSSNIPVVALFASRAENQIKGAFQSRDISKILIQISLDDRYLPDDDIRTFVNDSFADIKESHAFRDMLNSDWPSPEIVEEIVTKSSGQFIYASVVMKFIATARLHPAQQLEVIRGLRPSGRLTPYAQLDALYHHIFSRVEDIDRVSLILAYYILTPSMHSNETEPILGISVTDTCVALADLSSVINLTDISIGSRPRFLHASLPDFLLDETRSGRFYLDRTKWSECLAILCFNALIAGRIISYATCVDLLKDAECSPELLNTLHGFDPANQQPYDDTAFNWVKYIDVLKYKDFGDNGALYRQQLDRVLHFCILYGDRYDIENLRAEHDISALLEEIEKNEGSRQMLMAVVQRRRFAKRPAQGPVQPSSALSKDGHSHAAPSTSTDSEMGIVREVEGVTSTSEHRTGGEKPLLKRQKPSFVAHMKSNLNRFRSKKQ